MDVSSLSKISENYLSSIYSRNIMAETAGQTSFQAVLDANIKGQGLEDILKEAYPGLKYHVMDTSKINSSLWRRNDYPFEMFFQDDLDETALDWQPTSREPSKLDEGVQARLNAARGKYAIVVPPVLQEKLENNPELSQSIMEKISTLKNVQDSVPSSIDSFSITLDDEGNISNYRFSGGGGDIMMPSQIGRRKNEDKEAEEIKEQEQNQRLAAKRALQRKEQLEKEELDKRYQQSLREAAWLFEQNLL